jgi:hypothetical protein
MSYVPRRSHVGRRWRGKAGERAFPVRWLPLDYRFAAFGALLPDLIDKPLERLGIAGVPDGHTFAHTLVFAAGVIAAG